jgi:hypothetical protein
MPPNPIALCTMLDPDSRLQIALCTMLDPDPQLQIAVWEGVEIVDQDVRGELAMLLNSEVRDVEWLKDWHVKRWIAKGDNKQKG